VSTAVLTLFHDYTNPVSAVAAARLDRLAAAGLSCRFVGFEAIGIDAALPVTVDVIAAVDGVAAEAAAEGVTLRRPPSLPPTALAHVIGAQADGHAVGAAWRRACYRAFWADGADLADPGTLVELAGRVGLDREVAARAAADRVTLAAMRQRSAAYRRLGVGGVPTISSQRTLVPGLLAEADLWALASL
jgi:predicted DsbA family dithiol-disulfide isomerase